MTSVLNLYNTASGRKEVFQPEDPAHVKMYVCGPTVYNYIHIGNARPAVVFDVVYRLLTALYPSVSYARNITDVDDKIINAAQESGLSIEAITGRFSDEYLADMVSLGNLEPSVTPRATQHIEDMIHMVEVLLDKGHAYLAQGHVLFDVKSMPEYGRLSNRSMDDMLAGARVDVADYKRYAGDFVLWKPAAEGEVGWSSPWGHGRPGWHLECSAMIEKHLGETIDIHGGGRDLIFPHHENEVAQSCCAHDGKTFVRYWMHNGYINIDGEKMAKSAGNFRTVRELLDHFPGEVLRFTLLNAHYRSELDFSLDTLRQAKASLDTLYGFLREASDIECADVGIENSAFMQALLDDINTPLAISEMYQWAKQLGRDAQGDKAAVKSQLLAAGKLLGLLQADPDAWFQGDSDDSAAIDALVEERNQAKRDKNFARADEIRAQLADQGILLEDSREGTKWRRE
ncbi:MAG: cysteinyl-tRNA ligase [Pseudomonadota bacterium]